MPGSASHTRSTTGTSSPRPAHCCLILIGRRCLLCWCDCLVAQVESVMKRRVDEAAAHVVCRLFARFWQSLAACRPRACTRARATRRMPQLSRDDDDMERAALMHARRVANDEKPRRRAESAGCCAQCQRCGKTCFAAFCAIVMLGLLFGQFDDNAVPFDWPFSSSSTASSAWVPQPSRAGMLP